MRYREMSKIVAVYLGGTLAVLVMAMMWPAPISGAESAPMTHSVAMNNDLAVVGAQWVDGFKGVVTVLRRIDGTWTETQRLQPEDLERWAHFGSRVAIEGNTVVVAAPWQDSLRGAVYVYARAGDEWILQDKRTAAAGYFADPAASAESGDMSGVLAVVGGMPGEIAIAPALPVVAPDPPAVVVATDGVFENKTEVSWSGVDNDAIIYKVLRDGQLISIASSEDSLYVDEAGSRGNVYDYCVIVQDMGGLESPPRCDSGSRVIFPPADVVASDGDFVDGVLITWDDRSSVEAGYYLRRNGVPVDTLAANNQSVIDTATVPLIVYDYEVVAFDGDGSRSVPRTDDGFRGIVLPPLDVSASDGEYADSVVITWTAQSEAGDAFIVSRQNLASMDSTVLDTTVADAQTYTDVTAEQGIRYSYCVTSLDALGQLSISVCDEGGIDFPAPTNVQASDSTYDDAVEITWDDASDLEDGYQISRNGVVIDTTAADVTSYRDTDAVPNATHTYCVAAVSNEGGVSAPACDDGFRSVILAPTEVSATDGTFEDRVDITWKSMSTTVVVFKIFRGATFIKSVGADSRKYSDTGGSANTEYVYSVQALTALADESAAVSDAGSRELVAPSAVSATDAAFEDRVEITWSDNSRFESGFAVYRTPAVGSLPGALVGESAANVTTFVDRTAVPGTRYIYSVAAFDTDGESRGQSDSDRDEGHRELIAPRDVAADDGRFEDRVEITWEDRSSVEDGYYVYRDGILIESTADNATSYFDFDPVFGVKSNYSVRAYDQYGTSDADADSGYTTVLAPASFNASDSYPDAVVLRWVDLSEVEDLYVIRTDSADVTLRSDTLAANATSFTDVLAAANSIYDYRIRAIAGTAASEEVSDGGSRYLAATDIPSTPLGDRISRTKKGGRLTPDDGDGDDQFGWSAAIEGDVLIVGSPGDNPRGTDSGSAYAFERNPDLTWSQVDNLWAYQDGEQGDRFGEAVAIDGDRAIIGLPGRSGFYGTDDSKYGSGLALMFNRNADGTWSEGRILSPMGEPVLGDPMGPSNDQDRFGESVSIDGDVWVVGAPGDDFQNTGTNLDLGAVYFYRTSGGNPAKHFASDAVDGDALGSSVSVLGDWAVAGAPGCDDNGTESGAAYVYRFFIDSFGRHVWEEYAKLLASDGAAGHALGSSALRYGDRILIGAPRDTGVNDGPGAVYVFRFDVADSTWVEEAILRGGGGSGPDGFGATLAMNAGRLMVGAPLEGSGSFYIFLYDELNGWSVPTRFTAADGEAGDEFGYAVAVGNEWAFAGARADDVDTDVDAGSVYSLLMLSSVTNVTASDGEFADRVHIEWEDQSQSEEGVIIYRDGVEYDRLGPNESFYDDFDAEPGRTYKYQVSPISEFAGFAPERVPDFGWRPPDGHISGRVTSQTGAAVEGVSVCLEPPGRGALLFDGVGGHVRIPDDGTFNFSASQPFTVEVWFSYAGTDRSPRIVSKLSETGIEGRPIDLGLQRTGRVFFVMSDGANFARVMSQRAGLNDDTWHHVACINDAGSRELRLYIDGVLEATTGTAALGDVTNGSDIYIGGFTDATWFGGQVDELRVWTRARSADQIASSRTLPLAGNEPNLIGYWPFDALGGTSVTDFAGEAQYGEFVGGVYRTSDAAPLDVCVSTDGDGNFDIAPIRYEENGTSFRVRPLLPRHEFSPPVQGITLSSGHPVENQVNFTDVSSFTLSGRIQFADSDCFQRDVEILVDGSSAGLSDKNGKFSVSTDEGRHTVRASSNDFTFHVVLDGDTTETDSLTIDVVDDVPNILFLNTTRHTVSGVAGGSCDRYVGDITIRYRSESSCLDTTFAGYPSYTVDLPPLVYLVSATVDPATIPSGLSKSDVVSFFENLGEREIDLTAVSDTTLDFVYRAPLQVVITGFEPYQTCEQLVLENGNPLPANLPIVPQLERVDLVIRVEEDYGTSVCPLDSGIVVITDEIFDREDSPDTLTVVDGVAEYSTFASTPSLVAGRTEGGNDRSYQKALTATARVEGRPPVSGTEWVLVTGHVAPPGSEFVTFSTDVPLHILRDPPGDGSSAFLEKGFTACATVGLATSLTLETGVELKTEFGFKPTTFVGAGIGAFAGTVNSGGASAVLENKVVVGATITTDLNTKICLETTERFSTSSSESLVGEDGDVFIGAGVNFLFTEAGTIEVDGDCRVIRGSVAAFEPDSVETVYAFTEAHIEDVLIPELDSKVDLFADTKFAEVFAAERDNWLDILAHNRDLKTTAVTSENRSFSAGAEYSYTHENAISASLTASLKLYRHVDNKLGTDFDVNIFGAKAKVTLAGLLNIRTEVTGSAGGSTSGTRAVGYVLADDDPGDNFTVDIKDDGEFISPVFAVLAGKSSCPYEPWLDIDTGEPAMVARDRLALRVSPQQPDKIPPPDEPAVLKLTLENQSDETRDYELRSLSVSNPGGAMLSVNGSPVADGLTFTIAPESAHEATLTIERGPTRFFYPGLQLAMSPACGDDGIQDVVTFDVAFQTECSDITLFSPESGWDYDRNSEDAADSIEMILTGYEVFVSSIDSLHVENVGIEFRRLGAAGEGPGPWTDVFADSVGAVETLLAWKPAADLPDGVYELRAFARCNTGGRGYSGVATGTIDRAPPVVFGTPEPADGELSLGEDIRLTFNEPIDCRSVDESTVALTYEDGPDAGTAISISLVCDGSGIVIVPEVDANLLEGRSLAATVDGVRDRVGNLQGASVVWSFEFRKSLFAWSRSHVSKDAPLGHPGTVEAVLANGTSEPVDFAVTELPAFLSVLPADAGGRIAPAATRTIVFDIDAAIAAGAYSGQVTAVATDTTGSDTTGVAVLDVFLDVACVPPVWSLDPADFEYSMSIVGAMEVDGTGVPIDDAGDRLAAFVGAELRGVAGPVDVGGPKRVFLTVYSNRAGGETVRFEVWDEDLCKRYPGTIERYSFSADSVIGSTALPASFTAVETLPGSVGQFALNEGWNWFSTNVASGDMSVGNVLSTLSPLEGDIIKSKTAFASFDPSTPSGWVGTLATLDNVSGYMVRLSRAGTILQQGSVVDPTLVDIPVVAGWSWIAYAGDGPNAVGTALSDLDGQGFLNGGEVIRSQSAFAQWGAGWAGSLLAMEPGQGYRLYLQSGPLPGTFNYPANPFVAAGAAGASPPVSGDISHPTAAPPWALEPGRYEYNMTLIAALETDGRGWCDGDDVVAAFVDGECRGTVHLMRVEGVDRCLAFMMIHGNEDGEVATLRAFDSATGLTYDVSGTVRFERDAALGTASDPVVLETDTVRDGMPSAFRLVQNHPNPFNPQTTILFDLPRASRVILTIYNVRGQAVRTLLAGDYGPGRHRAVWDGTTSEGTPASSGVYFYRITAGSFTDVKKMVLLK